MLNVHLVMGVTVLVTNLVAGAWGAWCWYEHRPSVAFWYMLRVAQVAVVVQITETDLDAASIEDVLVQAGETAADRLG